MKRTINRTDWHGLTSALLAVSLLAAACGGGGGEDVQQSEGTATDEPPAMDTADELEVATVRGGTLLVGLESDAVTFLPGAGSTNVNVAQAIFDSIAIRGADGEIHPHLARSIEPSVDLTEWTITLREGIVFHDGTPLDAQAIWENFVEYLNAEGSTLAGQLGAVAELRIDGPLTYTYVLTEPNAAFPDLLTGAIGYPFSNTACRAAGEDCGSQPVGAGPFRLESWTRDAELRLVRNEDYWRTDVAGNRLPYLDEIIFRPIPDETVRLNSVLSGAVHVAHTLRQSSVRQARAEADTGRIQTFEAIGNEGGVAIFNTHIPPVDDRRVRRALVHASNQDDLIAVLGGTDLTPIQTQFYSPDSPWFSAAAEAVYPSHDLQRAVELLDEYRNDPARSDGKAVGEPVTVRFDCLPDPTLLDLAQTLQAAWGDAGVEVELGFVDQPTLVSNAFAGNYVITCFRMGGDQDPSTTLERDLGDPEFTVSNISNYTSDTMRENLEVLRTTHEFEPRYEAVERVMLELAEQVPLLWAGGTATAIYALPDVRNIGAWTTAEGVRGDGTLGATIYWAEVWRER